MNTIAIALILVGAFGAAVNQVLLRYTVNKDRRILSEVEALILMMGLGGVSCLVWFWLIGVEWSGLTPSSPEEKVFWLAVVGLICTDLILQFANVRSLKLADASFVTPIAAMMPGLLVMTALLFGEVPGPFAITGIAIMMVGLYVHMREGARTVKEYLQPLFLWRRVSSESSEIEKNKIVAARWAYLQAAMGSIGFVFSGLLARHGDPAFGTGIVLIALMLGFIILARVQNLTAKTPVQFEIPFIRRFRDHWKLLISLGISAGIPIIFLSTANRLAPIAYVGSLKRLFIIITVVLAVVFLKEKKYTKRRILLSLIVVAGALLIMFDPTPANVLNSADDYMRQLFN